MSSTTPATPGFDVLISGASVVYTCAGASSDLTAVLDPLPRHAVGVTGQRVAWIGPQAQVPAERVSSSTLVVDAAGGVVTPGLVDPHTHLVFAGNRADEFSERCAGVPYLEVAARGGGIQSTVRATNAATTQKLTTDASRRLRGLSAQGVTTVEVKSGYSLTVDGELRLLRIIRSLEKDNIANVMATLLFAHTVPPEYGGRNADYLSMFVRDLWPVVRQERLADFVDIFVERGAFADVDARRMAAALQLPLKMHVDQLTPRGGAQLAAELSALSADHLEQITPDGIAALAQGQVTAVLAPTSTLVAKVRPFAPGRALIDAGVHTALCTNLNPGTSATSSVSLAMGLACLENGLTPEEAFLGFTVQAARALGRSDVGALRVGETADIAIFRADHIRDLPYYMGMNLASHTLYRGRVVATGPEKD